MLSRSMVKIDRTNFVRHVGRVAWALAMLFCAVSAVRFLARSQGLNLFGAPALAVDPQQIDLGEVEPNSIVPVTVQVMNHGGGDLLISQVKGSCDACIRILSYPQKPITVGHPQQIRFEIDTGSTTGSIVKQAVIQSNDWTTKPLVLKFQWTIVSTP